MGDDDAIDIIAFGQLGNPAAQLQQVVVGDALGSNLHHLLAAHVGQLAQFGNTGNQLVDTDFGCRVSGAVGSAGTCSGNGAASGQNDDVGFAGRFLRLGSWQSQQQCQGTWND